MIVVIEPNPNTLFAVFYASTGSEQAGPILQTLHRSLEGACSAMDALLLGADDAELLEPDQAEWLGANIDTLVEDTAWGGFEGEPWGCWVQQVPVVL